MSKDNEFFSDVKVGDQVWDSNYDCFGSVMKVDAQEFILEYEDYSETIVNKDGHATDAESMQGIQRFWWSPPVIEKQERPKRMVKKERWVNIYRGQQGDIFLGMNVCETKTEVMETKDRDFSYITTVKVEWEEEE